MNEIPKEIINEAKELAFLTNKTAYIVLGKVTGRLFVSALRPISFFCHGKVTPGGELIMIPKPKPQEEN